MELKDANMKDILLELKERGINPSVRRYGNKLIVILEVFDRDVIK